MNIRFFNYIPLVVGSLIAMNSCVSTDTLEQGESKVESDKIVINLAAPEPGNTRATDGYKLRYIAKLFEGPKSDWDARSLKKTVEIIDGEVSNNRIEFVVDPNSYYGLLVFADYIPEESTADANGHYPDHFYNTTSYPMRYVMRSTPGKDTNNELSAEFFNNDAYDCFCNVDTIYKTKLERVVDMTLNRMVAQVVVQENTDNAGDCSVAIKSLKFVRNMDANNKVASGLATTTIGSQGITLQNNISSSQKNLFYHYTFANPTNDECNTAMEFEVTQNGKTVSKNFPSLKVQANYRTIIKGAFLPAADPDPGVGDTTKEGNIILNIAKPTITWEEMYAQ